MARSSKRSEFKTSRGTWQVWREPSGRQTFRVNGRFASSRAFNSAIRHSKTDVEISATLRVDPFDASPIQRDVAFTGKDNKWRAGPEANLYIPGLKRGQFLTQSQITELRRIRGSERNFWSFANLDQNKDLTRSEVVKKYRDFLNTIKRAKTQKRRLVILRDFGWSY